MPAAQLPDAHCTQSSPFKLPQELIDLVIDQFEDDNDDSTPQWVAVSLVARPWYRRTRDHLFGSITIDQDEFENVAACIGKIEGLSALFKANEELSRSVQSFCLFDVSTELFDSDPAGVGHAVVEILSLLSFLKEFLFHGMESPKVPPGVHNAIFSLVYHNNLKYLFLEDLSDVDIVSLVRHSNVETLILRACRPYLVVEDGAGATSPNPSPSFTPPKRTRPLKRLDVMSCGELLKNLLQSPADTCMRERVQLEDLCVATADWDNAMEDAFSLLVTSCYVETVKTYRIEQDCFQFEENSIYTAFPPSVFDPSRFPDMQTMTVTTIPPHFFHIDQRIMDPLLQGLDQLSRQSGGSKLRSLSLTFDYDIDDEEDGEDQIEGYDIKADLDALVEEDTWSRLDDILLRPGFSRLKSVTITFDFPLYKISLDDWECTKTTILQKMEGLNTRRKIVAVESLQYNP